MSERVGSKRKERTLRAVGRTLKAPKALEVVVCLAGAKAAAAERREAITASFMLDVVLLWWLLGT